MRLQQCCDAIMQCCNDVMHIPDVSKYWPTSSGSVKLSVEGFQQFPGKSRNLRRPYYGFMTSIVDSALLFVLDGTTANHDAPKKLHADPAGS
eukprot:2477973-Rhodomonas_salina.1